MKRIPRRKPKADLSVEEISCTTKVAYLSEAMARMGAKTFIYRSRGKRETLWPYRCDFCPGWHLTSRPSGLPRVTG